MKARFAACETDLQGCLGQPAPSHAPRTAAPLPGTEDLLDPAVDALDGMVPAAQRTERVVTGAAPHAGGDDPRCAALGSEAEPETSPRYALSARTSPRLPGRASLPARPSWTLPGVTVRS